MKGITKEYEKHAKKLIQILNQKAQDTWKNNPSLAKDYDIAMQTIKHLLDNIIVKP